MKNEYVYALLIEERHLFKAKAKTIQKPKDVTVFELTNQYAQVVVSPKKQTLMEVLYDTGLWKVIGHKDIVRIHRDILSDITGLVERLGKGQSKNVKIPIFKELC